LVDGVDQVHEGLAQARRKPGGRLEQLPEIHSCRAQYRVDLVAFDFPESATIHPVLPLEMPDAGSGRRPSLHPLPHAFGNASASLAIDMHFAVAAIPVVAVAPVNKGVSRALCYAPDLFKPRYFTSCVKYPLRSSRDALLVQGKRGVTTFKVTNQRFDTLSRALECELAGQVPLPEPHTFMSSTNS